MLTDKEVNHIAELARIKISAKEEQGLKKDLSSVLKYIEQLNEVDTENIAPLYQTTGLINSVRHDLEGNHPKTNSELNEKLIGQAPHKENGFIKVKSVLSHK